MTKQKAKYGIDAPRIVFGFLLYSIFILFIPCFLSHINLPFWFHLLFFYLPGLSLFSTACWMLYSSLKKKPKILTKLIEALQLRGNENLLDIGCGRGFLLIHAAKKLPQGKATGIDLWSTKDQSKNRKENTLANARAENVQVDVQTADMRKLPFADETFDATVSSLAIHNISGKEGREKALLEMIRVLKPGGKFFIFDITHTKAYANFLNETGKVEIKLYKPIYSYCPPAQIIQGEKK